jgi:hypothetical protein
VTAIRFFARRRANALTTKFGAIGSRMAKFWSSGRWSRRAFVAALVLCLFAMQALLSAGLAPRFTSSQGVERAGYCENGHDHDMPAAPGDHASCCAALCGACRGGGPLAALETPTAAPAPRPLPPTALLQRPRAEAPPEAPAGWTSSWSSRAPPPVA